MVEELTTVFAIILGLCFVALCWGFICYLIKAFTIFALAKRAETPRTWFAFIPFLQNMKLYNLAGFSEKTFLAVWLASLVLGCIPIREVLIVGSLLYTAFTIYVRVRTAQNFGGDTLLIILNVLFEPFVLIYFALSDRPFVPKAEWEPLEKFLHDCKIDTDFGVASKEDSKPKSEPIDVEIN